MAAHQRPVAQVEALVEDLPEFFGVPAGGQRHVDQIDRHDALIEAAVILRLAVLVDIGRQEAAAAHAGVAVPLAVFVDLQLEHFFLGDIVRHHAPRGALGGQTGQVIILGIRVDVILLEHVDQLREGRGDPDALLVFDALVALAQRLLNDDGKVVLLLRAARLAEVHEHGDEGRLTVGGHERDDLILDGLHAALDLLAQTLLDDLGDLFLRGRDAQRRDLLFHRAANFLAADVDERRKMRQTDGLPAVLVRGDLRDDLRGDVAGRREGMRLFDQRAGDDRAVLQHVLKVDQIAVVHVLGIIIRVVEVDQPGLMRLDDVARQQQTRRDVLGDLAGHIVALHGVDGGIFVRVLLLDLLVVALDQREDAVVGGVALANQRAGIAVGDIFLGDLKGAVRHDLILDKILDLLDGQTAVHALAADRDALGDAVDLELRQPRGLLDDAVGLADGGADLIQIEHGLGAVPFDDFHSVAPPFSFRRLPETSTLYHILWQMQEGNTIFSLFVHLEGKHGFFGEGLPFLAQIEYNY